MRKVEPCDHTIDREYCLICEQIGISQAKEVLVQNYKLKLAQSKKRERVLVEALGNCFCQEKHTDDEPCVRCDAIKTYREMGGKE